MRLQQIDDDSQSHWLMAPDEAAAKDLVIKALEDRGESDVLSQGLNLVPLEPTKRLTFHADRKAITHTVEDWEVIYETTGLQYIACSEY